MDACIPALPGWVEAVAVLGGGVLLAAPYALWRWAHWVGFYAGARAVQAQYARLLGGD